MLAQAGDLVTGLAFVKRGVERGYYAVADDGDEPAFRSASPAIRSFSRRSTIAETGRAQALAAFREAGGDRLLGL